MTLALKYFRNCPRSTISRQKIERDNSKILVWHRERFNEKEILKSKHIFINRINIPNRRLTSVVKKLLKPNNQYLP